jgi:hypothetical protein
MTTSQVFKLLHEIQDNLNSREIDTEILRVVLDLPQSFDIPVRIESI